MLQEAYFPVKEVPAIITGGTWSDEFPAEATNTGHKFIVREDTGAVISCMTDDYKLVKNETVGKLAAPIIKKNNGKLKEVRVFKGGARTTMKWQFPDHMVQIGPDDEMHPEIVVQNSYDGTIGVNIMAGAWRLICANGLVIGVVASQYRNKHSVYNVKLDALENIIDETMESTKLMFKDEFPLLIETPIKERHIMNFLKMFPIQANEIITQKLIADKPKTFWELLNVGTSVVTHNMDRNSQSTHQIENSLYPTMKKWANKEVGIA